MMYPVLDQLDAEGFDFSRFDLDKDGKIDSISTYTWSISPTVMSLIRRHS